jgi:hypothetical protein
MDVETITMLTGLVGTVMAFGLIAAALGGAWLLGRGWHRRDSSLGDSAGENLNAKKIAELMTRIEDLAVELERSAEAQRYLAKMLTTEQLDAVARAKDAMRIPERVVTPH